MTTEVELAISYQTVIITAQDFILPIFFATEERHQFPSFYCSLFSRCHCALDAEVGLRIKTT